jgi:exopolysaccharide biosynthesis polyprenyl glycosylphosphotransferase
MKASMQVKIKLALVGGDLVLISLCLALACYIRASDPLLIYNEYGSAWIFCLMVYPLSFYLTRSYEVQPEASSAENLRRPLLGLLLAAGATSVFFFFAPGVRFGRGIFAIANILLVCFLLAWRLATFLRLRRRSLSILLMGNAEAVRMARELIREFSPLSRMQDWQPETECAPAPAGQGPPEPRTVQEQFDLLILAGHSLDPSTLRKAAELRLAGVMVWGLPRLWSEFAGRLPARYIDERWLATAEGFRSLNEQSFQVTKRLLDIILAFVGLVLNSPVVALGAMLIKIQDGGAVFYSQSRVGKGGKVFRINKLRTMIDQAEDATGPVWSPQDDPRITRVGRWLRRLRIDEIPQMWNVLRGEMTFVGPRPERPVFVEALRSKFPVYSLRHLVRPGITGWAQVCWPYASSEEDNLRKLEYDLYYLQNASMLFDLRIILRTISTIASRSGSR